MAKLSQDLSCKPGFEAPCLNLDFDLRSPNFSADLVTSLRALLHLSAAGYHRRPLATRPIFDFCHRAERRRGTAPRQFWWDQEPRVQS